MITGVVLARDEEHNIVDCLRLLQPHVSEIILIDMESRDRTVELALPYVSRLLTHPVIDQFDAARNAAIDVAENDWLWFVDADEQIPTHVGELVNRVVREHGQDCEAISIPFKSYFAGQWIQYSGWWPGYTGPRVLKRGHFTYAKTLHGGVDVQGREMRLPPDPRCGVDHYSYRDVEHYLTKANRYTSTEAKQLFEQGVCWDWRQAVRAMVTDMWLYYERNEGHRDGNLGWLLAWLAGQYRWFSHAKLLDEYRRRSGNVSPESIPIGLDDVIQEMSNVLSRLRVPQFSQPLAIHLRSGVWGTSGFAEEGRVFARCLAQGDRAVRITSPPEIGAACPMSRDQRALLRALAASRNTEHSLCISNLIPSESLQPDTSSVVNVLRGMTETDRISPEWNAILERFDEIWTPSVASRVGLIRGGCAPERVRVVHSCLDTELYRPDHPPWHHPLRDTGRFVFLSVFDWQLRKGWDTLLEAYTQAFSVTDGAGLLLKVTGFHVQGLEEIILQANEALAKSGTSLVDRPDICLLDTTLSPLEMARLYCSVDAFVLPTRGEGWGRPLLEALCCGLPVIATRGCGSDEFLNDTNSYLVESVWRPVSAAGCREVPRFAGHQWREPDVSGLTHTLMQVKADAVGTRRRARLAAVHTRQNFGLEAGLVELETAIRQSESELFIEFPEPVPAEERIVRVEWDGSLFAGHSFSNVNEQILVRLTGEPGLALRIRRTEQPETPRADRAFRRRLLGYVNRELGNQVDVTVRHAFPPDWTQPLSGRWVHIQPWEFGYLPRAWAAPLRDVVDEIWVPSHYVQTVYERSGIPPEKMFVIPWGIDTHVFSPAAIPRCLPTTKTFCFLFVGGTMRRKGIDVLLEAYQQEFTDDDDVCLVIKDVGTRTFYRYGHYANQIRQLQSTPGGAEIIYFDEEFTPGQLAALYRACQCFVAPYRGEGFGLPILEAMGCGLPVIVPRGGPADDFVTDEVGFRIPVQETLTEHSWDLCGPPLEWTLDIRELRTAMRQAFEQQELLQGYGRRAASYVHERFTWEHTVAQMVQRIHALAPGQGGASKSVLDISNEIENPVRLAAFVRVTGKDDELANCLASLKGHMDRLHIYDFRGGKSSGTLEDIARRHGATYARVDSGVALNLPADAAPGTWWHAHFAPSDRVATQELGELRGRLSRLPNCHSNYEMPTLPTSGHFGSRVIRWQRQDDKCPPIVGSGETL